MIDYKEKNKPIDKAFKYIKDFYSKEKKTITHGTVGAADYVSYDNISKVVAAAESGILNNNIFNFKWKDALTSSWVKKANHQLPDSTKCFEIIIDSPAQMSIESDYIDKMSYQDNSNNDYNSETINKEGLRSGFQSGFHAKIFYNLGDDYKIFNDLQSQNINDSKVLELEINMKYDTNINFLLPNGLTAMPRDRFNGRTTRFNMRLYHLEVLLKKVGANDIYDKFMPRIRMMSGNILQFMDLPTTLLKNNALYFANAYQPCHISNGMLGIYDNTVNQFECGKMSRNYEIEGAANTDHIQLLYSPPACPSPLNSLIIMSKGNILWPTKLEGQYLVKKNAFNVSEGGGSKRGQGSMGMYGGDLEDDSDMKEAVKTQRNVGAGVGNSIYGDKTVYYHTDPTLDHRKEFDIQEQGSINIIYYK